MPWVESRQKARSACREIIHRSLVQPLYQRKVYTDEARIDLYSLEDARPLSDHGHMPSEVPSFRTTKLSNSNFRGEMME